MQVHVEQMHVERMHVEDRLKLPREVRYVCMCACMCMWVNAIVCEVCMCVYVAVCVWVYVIILFFRFVIICMLFVAAFVISSGVLIGKAPHHRNCCVFECCWVYVGVCMVCVCVCPGVLGGGFKLLAAGSRF